MQLQIGHNFTANSNGCLSVVLSANLRLKFQPRIGCSLRPILMNTPLNSLDVHLVVLPPASPSTSRGPWHSRQRREIQICSARGQLWRRRHRRRRHRPTEKLQLRRYKGAVSDRSGFQSLVQRRTELTSRNRFFPGILTSMWAVKSTFAVALLLAAAAAARPGAAQSNPYDTGSHDLGSAALLQFCRHDSPGAISRIVQHKLSCKLKGFQRLYFGQL